MKKQSPRAQLTPNLHGVATELGGRTVEEGEDDGKDEAADLTAAGLGIRRPCGWVNPQVGLLHNIPNLHGIAG